MMLNHFHLVIRPQGDGDLGRWVQWLLMAHTRRYHCQCRASANVWHGRFKVFPIQDDDHLRTVGLPDTRRLARGILNCRQSLGVGVSGTL
jgi:hypothetical protein